MISSLRIIFFSNDTKLALYHTTNVRKTHFLVLLLLTALSLIGFTAATLTITDADGNVPLESRMVFAGLSAVYVLFFNFCKDMNDPFDVSCDASFHICAFSYEHIYELTLQFANTQKIGRLPNQTIKCSELPSSDQVAHCKSTVWSRHQI